MIHISDRFIPLVDFHTHIGRVEIETTKGKSQRINSPREIIDLYEKLQYELFRRFSEKPDDYYITLPESAYQFAVPMHPLASMILEQKRPAKTQGWLVDHVVTFPFNDIFHLATKPKFVRSNDFVRKNVHKLDFTFKFIPFCRVDATDGAEACKEIENSVKEGSRGLKLHPMSQGWIDRINSPETASVLQTAGQLGIPTIFDIPNKNVAQDVTDIARSAREIIDKRHAINVVLGHTGFDYSSPSIFDNLAQDQMYCETSGMRGKDVELFFKNVMSVEGWFTKLLFGSDHNYFHVLQAADFITFLFSHQFIDCLEENNQKIDPYEAATMILGGNALRLIPKIWHLKQAKTPDSSFYYEKNKIPNLMGDLIKRKCILSVDLMNKLGPEGDFTDILVISRNGSYISLVPKLVCKDRVLFQPVDLTTVKKEIFPVITR
ncbi:MAG: amidohydrolase family protein, partial [Candidatus Odinarchaeota archaeon]